MSCFSWLPDGNCLFGSASSLINGTNDFICDLRILTALELFENCQQYCDHPLFSEVYNETVVYLPLFATYLMSVSEESSKQNKNAEDKVKHEALYCCQDNIYSSFINILAPWSKLIFSRTVEPLGLCLDNCRVEINLLWCPLGSNKPNHFGPWKTQEI